MEAKKKWTSPLCRMVEKHVTRLVHKQEIKAEPEAHSEMELFRKCSFIAVDVSFRSKTAKLNSNISES